MEMNSGCDRSIRIVQRKINYYIREYRRPIKGKWSLPHMAILCHVNVCLTEEDDMRWYMGRHLCTEQLRLSSTSQQDHRYQKMSIIEATHIQDREFSITAQPHREGHRCLHLDWFSAAAAPTRTQAINPSVLMTRSDSIRWLFRLTLG